MQSVAVESALVARIGYDPATKVLQATMRNGTVREVTDVNSLEYAEFMASPSKGKHWLHYFRARAKTVERESSNPAEKPEVAEPGLLQTFADDPCCTRGLAAELTGRPLMDRWICPKCGSEWIPRLVGTVRHWEPKCEVQVWPGRGRS